MQKIVLPLILATLALTACQEEITPQTEHVRSIKTYVVNDKTGGNLREYAGKVIAASSANLSFPVQGKVTEVFIQVGEIVAQGQILAQLDNIPFQLELNATKAELSKAKSSLHEKSEELKRTQKLYPKGWVSKAALDQAETAKKSAQSDVAFKQTRLNQAMRDLVDSQLKAPFNGVIAEKLFDANEDIKAGEKIFSIDSNDALQIAISVPEQTVPQVQIGMQAQASFSALKDIKALGRVTEIESSAGDASIFGVKVSLLERPQGLRPGMSSEVSLKIASVQEKTGFLIPLSAISAGDTTHKGYVFKFDETTSTLKKLPIIPQTAQANFIAVSGVNAGDVIASAGVSFLSDGLKVKLMR